MTIPIAAWQSALDFVLGRPREIAIVCDEGAQKLLDVVFEEYRPNQVVAFARDGENASIPL